MTDKNILTITGGILALFLADSSYAKPKDPPVKQVPHPSPVSRQAPVYIPAPQAPAPVSPPRAPMHAPPPQAPAHVPEQSRHLHRLPPQAPAYSPALQAPVPPTPKSHHLRGQPSQRPIIRTPELPSRLSAPSLNFGSPRKHYIMPWVGPLFSSSRGPGSKGVFSSIRTQRRGTIFRSWIPRPLTNIGGRALVTTSTAPRGFFTLGRRDFRQRDFFRHRFHRHFSFFFDSFPILVVPYYINYTEIYYPYYIEPYYPDYTESYYPDRIEPYPQYATGNLEPELSLEMQEIEGLLQSVFQAMRIFDIPEFYNKPELSILHPLGPEQE